MHLKPFVRTWIESELHRLNRGLIIGKEWLVTSIEVNGQPGVTVGPDPKTNPRHPGYKLLLPMEWLRLKEQQQWHPPSSNNQPTQGQPSCNPDGDCIILQETISPSVPRHVNSFSLIDPAYHASYDKYYRESEAHAQSRNRTILATANASNAPSPAQSAPYQNGLQPQFNRQSQNPVVQPNQSLLARPNASAQSTNQIYPYTNINQEVDREAVSRIEQELYRSSQTIIQRQVSVPAQGHLAVSPVPLDQQRPSRPTSASSATQNPLLAQALATSNSSGSGQPSTSTQTLLNGLLASVSKSIQQIQPQSSVIQSPTRVVQPSSTPVCNHAVGSSGIVVVEDPLKETFCRFCRVNFLESKKREHINSEAHKKNFREADGRVVIDRIRNRSTEDTEVPTPGTPTGKEVQRSESLTTPPPPPTSPRVSKEPIQEPVQEKSNANQSDSGSKESSPEKGSDVPYSVTFTSTPEAAPEQPVATKEKDVEDEVFEKENSGKEKSEDAGSTVPDLCSDAVGGLATVPNKVSSIRISIASDTPKIIPSRSGSTPPPLKKISKAPIAPPVPPPTADEVPAAPAPIVTSSTVLPPTAEEVPAPIVTPPTASEPIVTPPAVPAEGETGNATRLSPRIANDVDANSDQSIEGAKDPVVDPNLNGMDEEEDDDEECHVCMKVNPQIDETPYFIYCLECEKQYHFGCHVPTFIPPGKGEFKCSFCIDTDDIDVNERIPIGTKNRRSQERCHKLLMLVLKEAFGNEGQPQLDILIRGPPKDHVKIHRIKSDYTRQLSLVSIRKNMDHGAFPLDFFIKNVVVTFNNSLLLNAIPGQEDHFNRTKEVVEFFRSKVEEVFHDDKATIEVTNERVNGLLSSKFFKNSSNVSPTQGSDSPGQESPNQESTAEETPTTDIPNKDISTTTADLPLDKDPPTSGTPKEDLTTENVPLNKDTPKKDPPTSSCPNNDLTSTTRTPKKVSCGSCANSPKRDQPTRNTPRKDVPTSTTPRKEVPVKETVASVQGSGSNVVSSTSRPSSTGLRDLRPVSTDSGLKRTRDPTPSKVSLNMNTKKRRQI